MKQASSVTLLSGTLLLLSLLSLVVQFIMT